ncbi:MAG TPA: NlpC/P60 family protein [Streptosporangiaceae bacterium]|jgi:cell wall-associated NlpC family hydrolase
MGRRTAILGVVAIFAALLPTAVARASTATSPTGSPTLDATLAQANKLAQQIDSLSQQYDSLRIQLAQAQAEAKLAQQNAARDLSIFSQDQGSIAAIAVENYMSGGLNPTLQLLTTNSPQSLLDRASIMTQLQRENGAKVSLVASAETAAQRALAAAAQQQHRATQLAAEMQTKVSAIQQRENFFNSQAFAQAAAIYQQTGQYPNITVNGNSVGVQALKWALTKVGDPYVWGAAGPNSFDCSGLVMWAYAQVGISLLHFTGDQWNEGEHISRDQLEPGDLVFFFADISHVGLYIGNGLMVDAPTFGIPVHVEPVFWSSFVGAVRIVA